MMDAADEANVSRVFFFQHWFTQQAYKQLLHQLSALCDSQRVEKKACRIFSFYFCQDACWWRLAELLCTEN